MDLLEDRGKIVAVIITTCLGNLRDGMSSILQEQGGMGDMPKKTDDNLRIEWEMDQGSFVEYRFHFTSEALVEVPCHLWVPKDVKKPCPVVICLQGHSTGMHISMGRSVYAGDENLILGGDRDFAIQIVREGYAACMEERIKIAMPSCSVCSYKRSITARRHCPCNYLPGIAKYVDMGELACLIAPRKLILVAGEQDSGFTIDGVHEVYETIQKIYKKAGVPDWCRLVVGSEGHRFYANPSWDVFRELSGW